MIRVRTCLLTGNRADNGHQGTSDWPPGSCASSRERHDSRNALVGLQSAEPSKQNTASHYDIVQASQRRPPGKSPPLGADGTTATAASSILRHADTDQQITTSERVVSHTVRGASRPGQRQAIFDDRSAQYTLTPHNCYAII